MECIVNYPDNEFDSQILLNNVAKLNAKLVISEFNNLNIQNYHKNEIIKKLVMIKDRLK